MKKKIFVLIFLFAGFSVFAQGTTVTRLPTVGIPPFEASGAGVSAADAGEATRLVIAELSSWGYMTILEGDRAKDGEYLIQGQISRQNNQTVLTAVTSEGKSGKNLNSSKEQAPALGDISVESFCTQVTENIPFPNYLLGRWQSTINMIDGPVTCIMEFRSDRTVRVQQYDTWEHDGTNSLKYQGIGSGTYSYAGYRRRNVSINGRDTQADATVGINLKLEDALPKYVTVSRSSIRVLFDDSRTSFELLNAGFPCGDNYSGPSVYPSAAVSYTKFIKIQ